MFSSIRYIGFRIEIVANGAFVYVLSGKRRTWSHRFVVVSESRCGRTETTTGKWHFSSCLVLFYQTFLGKSLVRRPASDKWRGGLKSFSSTFEPIKVGKLVCWRVKNDREKLVKHRQSRWHLTLNTQVVTRAPVDCMCRPCTAVEESAVMPQEIARYLDDGSFPFKI